MTLVQESVRDAAIGVGMAQSAAGLSAIHHPGCAATIWQRSLEPSFQSWIDALEPECLPKARVTLPIKDVRAAAAKICDMSATPNCIERQMLVDDTAVLAATLGEIMDVIHVQLRFDVVSDNACPKFHIDAIIARFICTYRGAGTQYGISTDGSEPKRIFSVSTGSPMLMRGTRWSEQPKSGLLHRSPPIEGTGETRLLFVLDPVADPEKPFTKPTMH